LEAFFGCFVRKVAPRLHPGLGRLRGHRYVGDVRGMGLIAAI